MQRRSRHQEVSAADHRAIALGPRLDGEFERRALAESLARMLAEGDAEPRRGRPWDITMPADLDSPRPSEPFEEPLRGMAIREVIEPQIFKHFFGVARRR
jgi:hypothetical protein